MINKLLWILIIAAGAFVGWKIFEKWDEASLEKSAKEKQAPTQITSGGQLGSLTQQLESSLQAAQKAGPGALKNWLKQYGHLVQDPRKGWIELDYAVMVSRDDPREAKRVFAEVKNRTLTNSQIYPRIKQLEKTYE